MKKLIIVILFVVVGCNQHTKTTTNSLNMESPLSSVVKLISAESFGNIEEARKYIDVKRVYAKHLKDTVDFESIWKEQVKFKSSKDDSPKFTNYFKYFNYTITETINNSTAKVIFVPIDQNAHIKKIIYSLDKAGDKWKVVEIQYIN